MIAKSAGGLAEVRIESPYIVTVNHPKLTEKMGPTLKRVAGPENTLVAPKIAGAEDFSFYQEKIPGLFFIVGVSPRGSDLSKVAFNHSPRFYIDESGLSLGVRALANLTVDYLDSK
jgi:amidohydrolase